MVVKEMVKSEKKKNDEQKGKEEKKRKRREKAKIRKEKEKERKEKEKERKIKKREREKEEEIKKKKKERKRIGRIIKKAKINDEVRLNPQKQIRKLIEVRRIYFGKVMEEEREGVMMFLRRSFRRLSYWDLEEVYSDGCFELWKKLMDENFELKENSLDSYLKKICWNIGMHYLRKVKDDEVKLDELRERNYRKYEDVCGLDDVLEVIEKKMNEEEKYEMLERMWDRISDVDRMILESYYLDGCKMDEIARRIGYKNGDSVKSRKNKILKMIKKKMVEVVAP